MGLPVLCTKLMEHGLPASTPIAVVQQGTTPSQKVVTGTLDTMPAVALQAGLKAPTLIIVGEVVKLRDKLNWYGKPGS